MLGIAKITGNIDVKMVRNATVKTLLINLLKKPDGDGFLINGLQSDAADTNIYKSLGKQDRTGIATLTLQLGRTGPLENITTLSLRSVCSKTDCASNGTAPISGKF